MNNTGGILWQKTYGGSADDEARAVHRNDDGTFMIVGNTQSFGASGQDGWIFKLDASGNLLSQQRYGGSGNGDQLFSIVPITNLPYMGGYLVGGQSNSFGANGTDYWLMALAANGAIHWQKLYDRSGTSDNGHSAIHVSDGNVIVGYSASISGNDFWVVKVDHEGALLWSKTYGGTPSNDYGLTIMPAHNGGYIVVGYSDAFGAGDFDAWVLHISATDGSVLWQNAYGGIGVDTAAHGAASNDGTYLITGYETTSSENIDLLALKIDPSGVIRWQRSFGLSVEEKGFAIQGTEDGGAIIVGCFDCKTGGDDFWVVKVDADGNLGTPCSYATSPAFTPSASSGVTSVPTPNVANSGVTPVASGATPATSSASSQTQCE